jgi:hypothetical protein
VTEYQQIEYRIGKDGKIVETMLQSSGSGCIDATANLEQALGVVESQVLLPEYYDEGGDSIAAATPSLMQR